MKLIDDCFVHDKDRIRHDDAIALLRDRLSPVTAIETIALEGALGRYTAEPIYAPRPRPQPTDNAAVDGFAFYQEETEKAGGDFTIIERVAAGDTPKKLSQKAKPHAFSQALLCQRAPIVLLCKKIA